jgi:hypothetical protein
MGCWWYAVVGEAARRHHMFFCALLISLPTVIALALLTFDTFWWVARKSGARLRRS